MLWSFRALPLGPPAISTNVGNQSSDAKMSVFNVPGLMTLGQRMTSGTRMPPSGGELVGLEGCNAAVREGLGLGAVIGCEDYDGVVELAHILQLLEHVADVVIHLGRVARIRDAGAVTPTLS